MPDPRLRELHVRLVSARRALDSLRRDLEAASELLHQVEEEQPEEPIEHVNPPFEAGV